MSASYKKLWKILIDKELKKKDLEKMVGVSHYTINKLNKGENITTDVLEKVCRALDCTASDIMEFVSDDKNKNCGE
ncbi:MAG: helix-turn-helix domain-containing protein [Lachnospiraceae bacterium]|nr:helix-turn-helix domain-containing protein [Lachnospiraceae bacterium]